MIIISAIIAFIGLAASAIASGTETGIYVLNRVRLAVRAGHGNPRAVRLQKEIRKPERMLATLLMANNMANYAGSLGVAATSPICRGHNVTMLLGEGASG